MIDSETSSITEFTSPELRNWESQIRVLVRIASLSIFALFLMEIFENKIPIFPDISIGIIILILGIFVVGLVLGFLQLRYLNFKRNKLTNIGGFFGFLGLLITGIPCSCELVIGGLVSSSILDVMLVAGLLLAVFGFFTEVTQLDQILIYFVRINFWLILKYTVTGIGAFLVNYGILIIFLWPRELVGIWAIFAGLTILLGTWYKQMTQLIWENKVHLLRTIELTVSEVFFLYMLLASLSPIIISGVEINIETFFITFIFGVTAVGVLYFDLFLFKIPEDYNTWSSRFFKRILYPNLFFASVFILLGILYPESLLQGLNELILIFRLFYSATGFLLIYRVFFKEINQYMNNMVRTMVSSARYLWSIRFTIARGTMTFSGLILIILPMTPQLEYVEVYIRYLLIIVGIGVLYLAWISRINNFFVQTARAIKKASIMFGHFVWDTGGAIKQATIDIFQYLWLIRQKLCRAGMTLTGWLISVYAFSNPNLGPWLQPILFGLGLVFFYVAWYVRVNNFIKQLFSAIVNGFVLLGTYIKNTGVAIKEAIISFGEYIWLIRMGILRAGMTIVGPILMIYGIMSSSLGIGLQGFLFGGGLVIFYFAWITPINDFIIRLGHSLVHGLKTFGHYVWDLGVTFRKSLIFFGQYLWLIRVGLLRVSMTTLGPILMLYSLFTPSLGIFIQGGLFATGLALLYGAWFTSVNNFLIRLGYSLINGFKTLGHFVWDVGVAIKESIISFGNYIWVKRLAIIRSIMTVIGPILLLYGIFTPSLGTFIQIAFSFLGLVLLYIAWIAEVNVFIIQTARTISNTFVNFSKYLWSHREDILRVTLTIIGLLLLISPVYNPSIDPLFRGISIVFGLLILTIAWFAQISNFLIQTVVAIKKLLISIGRAVKQSILDFCQYLWNLRWTILRSCMTLTGLTLNFLGLMRLFERSDLEISVIFIILGSVLLILAWTQHIVKFLELTLQSVIKMFEAFLKLGSKILDQALNLLGALLDSIIYILIVSLGVTSFGYGVILVITGLLDDKGKWTKAVIYPIPIIGDILWLFASILQGVPLRDVENLVGIFADDPVIVLLLLGLIFMVVGIVAPFITYFSRDSIKISNLQERFGDHKDEDVYKGGKGDK